jgi:hypothetical protein
VTHHDEVLRGPGLAERCRAKLERAKDHFEALAETQTAFLRDPDTYDIALEVNKQRRPVLRVEDIKEPGPDWGLLIGDCVHNLRSALDHLAFQLMLGNRSGRVPRELVKSSAFPIYLSSREFRKLRTKGPKRGQPTPDSGLNKIVGVSATATAIIERLQPYHRRKNPGTRTLWELQELSNTDKHRLFPLIYSTFELGHFQIRGNVPFELREFESVPGRLKRNAVIARWAYVTSPQLIRMRVDAELVTDITFNKGTLTPYPVRGRSVLFTLHRAMRFIAEEVVPPLPTTWASHSTSTRGVSSTPGTSPRASLPR